MSKLIKKVFKAVKKVASGVGKFVKKYWKQIAIAALVVFTAGAASVVAAGGTWGGALTSVGSTFSAGASALTGGVVGTSAVSSSALGTGVAAANTAAAGGVSGAINGAATSVGNVVGGGLKAIGIQGNAAAGGVNAASNAAALNGGVLQGTPTLVDTGAGMTETIGGVTTKIGGAVTPAATPAAGMSVGKAMLIGTGVQAAGALYQGHEQKKAEEQAKKDQEDAYFYGMNSKGQYAAGFDPSAPSSYSPPAYQSGAARAYTPNPPTLLNRAAYQLPKV